MIRLIKVDRKEPIMVLGVDKEKKILILAKEGFQKRIFKPIRRDTVRASLFILLCVILLRL